MSDLLRCQFGERAGQSLLCEVRLLVLARRSDGRTQRVAKVAISCYSMPVGDGGSMWRVAAAGCGLLLLGACSGESSDAASAPVSTEVPAPSTTATESTTTTGPPTTATTEQPTTTTAAPTDPFAIPDDPADIDEAYVERVINEHNRIIGDALRIELAGGDIREIVDRYNAVYVQEFSDSLLTALFAATPEDLAIVKEVPGDAEARVIEITDRSTECIRATVEVDYGPVRLDFPALFRGVVVLRRDPAEPDPKTYNVTPWLSEGYAPPGNPEDAVC